ACGARVLVLRSVEYARNHGVRIHVRSSFHDEEGTWVVKEEELLEQAIISGIAHDTSEAEATIQGVPDQPGIAARLFRPLADAGVNIGIISTSSIRISCVVREADVERAVQVVHDRFRLSEDVILDGDAATG